MARRDSRAESSPPPEEPEEEESAEESSSDDEPVEANLATRTRRSNAGNRMAALIEDEATAEVEEMFKEEEGDDEFETKEEKDEFDSDFGSTDEDAGEEDDDEAGERQLRREAKEAKKAERGKRKGFQAPVHPFARQTKTARKAAAAKQAGPVASTSAATLDEDGEPAKKRKKVAVDPAFLVPQRESSRRQAVQNKKLVQDRLKESEQRKATTVQKPVKKQQATLTQADLIAEALEVEEQNRAALLAFYAAEEERREAERVAGMRYEIIGPKLTFLSRVQDCIDKGKGKAGEQMERGRKRLIEVVGESASIGWKASGPEAGTSAQAKPSPAFLPPSSVSAEDSASPNLPLTQAAEQSLAPPSTPPEPREYARNWLVFDQFEGSRADELEALFGDHVDWSKRPAPIGQLGTCPLTGLPARYRDPLTLVPYANISAFHQLRAMASPHSPFVWSDNLGAYTGASGFGLMADVELGWTRRPDAGPERYALAAPHAPQLQHQGPAVMPPAPYYAIAPGAQRPSKAAQQHPSQEENPYKISYAHAGGSGRGQRGRVSLDAAAEAQQQQQQQQQPPPPQPPQQKQAPPPPQQQKQAPTARTIPGARLTFGDGVSVNAQGQAVLPLGGLPPLPPFPS